MVRTNDDDDAIVENIFANFSVGQETGEVRGDHVENFGSGAKSISRRKKRILFCNETCPPRPRGGVLGCYPLEGGGGDINSSRSRKELDMHFETNR
jgi:hypothetical protein